jgi:succinate dehydrogenase/fumarate reductase flavoprotein subunit
MIAKILKSRWFWIGVVIFGVLAYSTARDWAKINELKKEALALKDSNDKLKGDAKTQEASYVNRLNENSKQQLEIARKMQLLIGQNQELVRQNDDLRKAQFELEKKYAEIQDKFRRIKVPDSRADRVGVFRQLGY